MELVDLVHVRPLLGKRHVHKCRAMSPSENIYLLTQSPALLVALTPRRGSHRATETVAAAVLHTPALRIMQCTRFETSCFDSGGQSGHIARVRGDSL